MSGRFWVTTASALLSGPVFLWAPARAEEPKKPEPAKKADKPAGGADVFGHEKVWQFHLTMTAAEYAAMQPAQPGGFPGFPGGFPPKQ